MQFKKGIKFLRLILLVWMILNLSILPFASAYSDDNPKISFTRKASTSYLNGTFGKITAISSNKLSSSPAHQSLKPITYSSILPQNSKISLQKSKNFIQKQPSLFIMVVWSLFITLLTSFIYSKQNKKSQLTIFFLLGLVMISLFFFMYYLRHSVTETRLKKEAKKISADVLETPAIKNYVQICLDDSTKEALVLAGLQGGVIYSSFNNLFGLEIDSGPNFGPGDYGILGVQFNLSDINISDKNSDLIYAIIKPRLSSLSKYHPDVPKYPYEGNLRSLIKVDNQTILNSLGNSISVMKNTDRVSNLRWLCSKQGSNYINASVKFSCEEDLYMENTTNSVQIYLEEYIKKNVNQCINFSSFIPETGFELEEGNISIEVLFGENNVYVTMEYPLKITIEGQAPVTRFLLYHSDIKVKFKKIYELAYHLIKEDVGNIFFNMEADADSLSNCATFDPNSSARDVFNRTCLENGMSIRRQENVCPNSVCNVVGNYSDAYVIIDNRSLIDGNPFVFLFASENRRPALDYIDHSINGSSYYNGYLTGFYGRNALQVYNKSTQPSNPFDDYNIIVDVYQPIEILPFGIDPDDNKENLTYTYSGWMTPIEIYNESGAYLDGDSALITNYWESSNYYRRVYTGYIPLEIPVPSTPPDFPKDADIETTSSHVGIHWVRVNITDEEGLSDYQDIKIQVRCNNSVPNFNLDCCNNYYEHTPGERCGGVNCKRCSGQGDCGWDRGTGISDCGPCRTCGDSEAIGCVSMSSPEDPRSECNGPVGTGLYPGDGMCCGGTCNQKSAVPRPWVVNPSKESGCYNPNKACDGTSLIYQPVPAACSSCGSGTCICDNGFCVDDV